MIGFCGIIPILLKNHLNEKMLGVMNCFAAGIFLVIAFMHLLKEATEDLTGEGGVTYPLAPLLAIVGYLLVLMVDKVMVDSDDQIDKISSSTKSGVILEDANQRISTFYGNRQDEIKIMDMTRSLKLQMSFRNTQDNFRQSLTP